MIQSSNPLELSPIRVQLKLQSLDGKHYRNRFSQTPKSLFRISSRSPRRGLNHSRDDFTKAGYERVQEIEDPELAQKRVKENITKESIPTSVPGKKVRGIAVRYSN